MSWISVDGLEGAGKTTVTRYLAHKLPGCRVLAEFSKGFAGKALASAVLERPHYISNSHLAQSLFFIGEFVEKIESFRHEINDAKKIVVSDRGLLSKIVYQKVILDPIMGEKKIADLFDIIFSTIPRPDVTICLTVEPEIARKRIISRGQSRTKEDLIFMRSAAKEFTHTGNEYADLCIDTSRLSVQQTCSIVHEFIDGKLDIKSPSE